MRTRFIHAVAISLSVHDGAIAADFLGENPTISPQALSHTIVSGRVSVVDGRTLWFPADRRLVRLSTIETCGLVQWSFDPNATSKTAPALAPLPCGALARAWLKKSIGGRSVHCNATTDGYRVTLAAQCRVGDLDLALEMLRVGWAKLSRAGPHDGLYAKVERSAIKARYGMWGTYVLDMPEWRQKAVDKTLGRQPQADINLLRQRESEISPAFSDARRQPARRDR